MRPTAIRCGLPVNTKFGFREIKGLESELQKPEYRNATVFVAWEHGLLDEFCDPTVTGDAGCWQCGFGLQAIAVSIHRILFAGCNNSAGFCPCKLP
jgi:hypothetical protein